MTALTARDRADTFAARLRCVLCAVLRSARSEHTLPITALCCGHGEASALVATGSLDRTVKLHRMSDGRLLRTVPLPTSVHALAMDAGGQARGLYLWRGPPGARLLLRE